MRKKIRKKSRFCSGQYNGFWLHYRRLEQSEFKWLADQGDVISIDYREFRWLLDGLQLKQPQAHKAFTRRAIL